jgi:hypothetical protein
MSVKSLFLSISANLPAVPGSAPPLRTSRDILVSFTSVGFGSAVGSGIGPVVSSFSSFFSSPPKGQRFLKKFTILSQV